MESWRDWRSGSRMACEGWGGVGGMEEDGGCCTRILETVGPAIAEAVLAVLGVLTVRSADASPYSSRSTVNPEDCLSSSSTPILPRRDWVAVAPAAGSSIFSVLTSSSPPVLAHVVLSISPPNSPRTLPHPLPFNFSYSMLCF